MKKILIANLLRPEIKKINKYIPSQTREQLSREVKISQKDLVKLDTGENPYGEKFQDKAAVKNIPFYSYPDPASTNLRKKISEYTNLPTNRILCGNGSDEIIDLILRAFVNANEEIIICPPTFPMYEFLGQIAGVTVKKILRNKDFSVNVEKIKNSVTKKTKVLFIDSPGNPTGTITPVETFEELLKLPVIVVADEAYFEYCQKTVISLVKKYPNLIILRTFSKWAGLAGLRVGYAIASSEIIDVFLSIKQPYNVNSVAQKFAEMALDNRKTLLERLKDIIVYRENYYNELSKFKELTVYKTQGAYVVFKAKNNPQRLYEFLRKNGILVKSIKQPLLGNSLRMTLAKGTELKKVIKTLTTYYEN